MQHCIKGEQYEDLKSIMKHAFAGVELKLYLDTHPWDQEARNAYNHHQNRTMELEQDFFQKNSWMSDECCGIFPWELNYECE